MSLEVARATRRFREEQDTMNTLAKQQNVMRAHEAAQAPIESSSIIQVIERAASDPNVDIEKMERLLAMQERIMAHKAKAEFTNAFAQMQTDLPVIEKRGRIDIGRGKPQAYALWEDINETIKPVLANHGFALSFRVGKGADSIKVVAVLSHIGGHSDESDPFELPADTSGSKNMVQGFGSSVSYAKRYTAGPLLNLTFGDEDDDGMAAGVGEKIADEQRDELIALADEVGADKAKFCKYMKVPSLADIPAAQFVRAKSALESKRQKVPA